MAQVSLPHTLGGVENVNQLNSNLDALVTGVNSVDTSQLDATTVLVPLGLTGGGSTRRGKATISGTETTTSSSFTTLTTPDRVSNVVLASEGLLIVRYQALWKESSTGTAQAAIFLGANQLKSGAPGGAPAVQAATIGGTANFYVPLSTHPGGLESGAGTTADSTEVTTGQLVQSGSGLRGGTAVIFAAAGTYTVTVQFKTSSGTVSVKNRHLWVEARGF